MGATDAAVTVTATTSLRMGLMVGCCLGWILGIFVFV